MSIVSKLCLGKPQCDVLAADSNFAAQLLLFLFVLTIMFFSGIWGSLSEYLQEALRSGRRMRPRAVATAGCHHPCEF